MKHYRKRFRFDKLELEQLNSNLSMDIFVHFIGNSVVFNNVQDRNISLEKNIV